MRNDRIALSARTHHFDDVALVPFLCECSDDRCSELLRMPLAVYRAARQGGDFLTAPGHQVDGAAIVRIKDCCWLHRSPSHS